MLKLQYLFHNADLAEMLLKNWEYEQESLHMFQRYRISSNAIYPFRADDAVRLLRFAPISEKRREEIEAELEFIAYLRWKGYDALKAVPSKEGEKLVEAETPWGTYYASVFNRVPGVQLGETEMTDEVISLYGSALGRLHRLSSDYEPQARRRTHADLLSWMEEELAGRPGQTAAITEIGMLSDYFASVPMTRQNYGLIHYDFECDNVFYDSKSHRCYAIDFDDAMYHWFVMDIVQSLDSLQDAVASEAYEQKKLRFLDGYRSEFEISGYEDSMLTACARFANLYGYVRVLRSIEAKWHNEPEWMVQLRGRLQNSLNSKAARFGTTDLLPPSSHAAAGCTAGAEIATRASRLVR